MNEILERLPKHLRNIIIDQPYNEYTEQDHAVWRYIMRRNVDYLPQVAHKSYLDGLKKTGISINRIPHMYGMNRILKEIGWAAVAVDGFIPPAAFMEFQAYNVLVIAADIRPIDQVLYTPAPDIVHEAAGHAPIIAEPEYAGYLRRFGQIGSRAFSSAVDYQQYEAIRHLSILKADPYSDAKDIRKAEQELAGIEARMDGMSEMARIRNLHWWTVEYGLLGSLEKPRIYGAGLLSSIGESFSALQDDVKKLPYNLDAAFQSFDITTRQPQLFVTPDFAHLNKVLDQFADTMALRRGGVYALQQAKASENLATVVWSSGLQVSGVLHDFIAKEGEAVYLSFKGETALSWQDAHLEGHGKGYHKDGFGSPAGMWANSPKPPEMHTEEELYALGMKHGQPVELDYESGLRVSGILRNTLWRENKLLLLSFSDCWVKYENQLLFQPEWGMYDMAVGANISSAFSGLADPEGWGFAFPVPNEKTHKIVHDEASKRLHRLYAQVRALREGAAAQMNLPEIWEEFNIGAFHDWLLPLEILELLAGRGEADQLKTEVKSHLQVLKSESSDWHELIQNGLELIAKRGG